jgi:hypothetical protein
MDQLDLFHRPTGDELRDAGITSAERDRKATIDAVDYAISVLARTRLTGFTAEDVRGRLDRHIRDLEDVSKVIGGRMRAAALAGLIYTTGQSVTALRADAHSRRMLIWQGKPTINMGGNA